MDEPRAFGPITEDSNLLGKVCPGCSEEFKVGDIPTIVAIGPGDDAEERERAREGRPYNAIAVPAHYACVTGRET